MRRALRKLPPPEDVIRVRFLPHVAVALRQAVSDGRYLAAAETVGRPGIEPGTNSLKGYCSTFELPSRSFMRGFSEGCCQSSPS